MPNRVAVRGSSPIAAIENNDEQHSIFRKNRGIHGGR